jgi:hypothetical protein
VTDPLDVSLIGRHLRDHHGFTLAESMARPPYAMRRLHETQHEVECSHTHDDNERTGA